MLFKLKGKTLIVNIDDDIFGGYWWGISYNAIRDGLDEYEGQFDEIRPVINSNGGSVTEGMAIRALFQDQVEKGIPVNVEIAGVAASIASVIALSGSSLKMRTGSYLMIHRPYTVAAGDYEDMRNVADTLEKMLDDLISIYASKSSLDRSDIEAKVDAETWLTAAESKEYGFASEVIEVGTGEVLNYHSEKTGHASPFMAHFKNAPSEVIENKFPINKAPEEPTNKGERMPGLTEALASDSQAQAEFDAKIAAAKAEAKAEGEKASQEAFQARVDKTEGILNSEKYPQAIKSLATSVICNKADMAALDAAVAAFDATMEANNSANAQDGTDGDDETPSTDGGDSGDAGDAGEPENNGRISSAADSVASAKRVKGA